MNILSEDRHSYLSQVICDKLIKLGISGERDIVFKKVKSGLNLFIKEWMSIDQKVQDKIKSIKRGIIYGSSEWQVLYNQYFEEEFSKLSVKFNRS